MSRKRASKPSAEDRAAFEACLDMASRVRGGRVAAHWMSDGRFWFVEGAPENTCIRTFDPNTGASEPLFDTARVRAALEAVIGREPPYLGLPFEAFTPTADGGAAFTFEGTDYVLNAAGDRISRPPGPSGFELAYGTDFKTRNTPRTFAQPSYFHGLLAGPEPRSPDGRWFAGVQNCNLYLRSAADGRIEQITRDGAPDCSWDVETVRAGLTAGGVPAARAVSPWSPDGLRLFATQFDKRGCGAITRTHLLKPVDEVERFGWTRSGEKLPEIVPFVIYTMDRSAIRLQVDTRDRFLLFLGWSKCGTLLYLVQYSRDMKAATVLEADALTGRTRTVYSEQGDSFIRIQHEVIWGRTGCALLPDGRGFVWESERDGWKHLYHYDLEGTCVARITQGDWPVADVQGFDPGTGMIYFTAHHDPRRPYDVHLCRVPLAGGTIERLTEGEGIHDIQMAPDYRGFIDTISKPDTPPRSVVRDITGRSLHRFPPMDISALQAIGWTAPEEFCVKAADGETDLWGVICKPRHFDAARSYPVIEYIYGGPQIAYAPHHFQTTAAGMWGLTYALPQLGYVCVALDARGTPERSKAFHDVTFKEWRRHVTADHAAALKNLAEERPWMDLGRVGIWGHSWGGYNTFACMIDAPEVYRAGVCSAPGFDPYDLFIYEPYLGGVPAPDNRAAYEDALLYSEAPRLKGRLMIVAGSDDVGVWHSAMKMTHALIESRRDHEFVALPGQHHGFSQRHEAYVIDKLVGHFDRYVRDATGDSDAP